MQALHCQTCPTRRLCLGADLDQPALASLSQCVQPSAPVQRGEFLYRAGDPADDCFVVRSGAYKTVVTSNDGQEHVGGFHFPGEIMGLSGQATGRYRDSAVALETSTACRTSLAELPQLWRVGSGPALLRLLGSNDWTGAEGHANLSRTAADARLAGYLVGLSRRLSGRAPDHLPMPMSRTDLANHLGMTLESLSRVIGRLTRDGTITPARTAITVNDPERLQRLAGHLDQESA
ncbi:MAG: helix-turn-helix domain-containing protein [Pseudomonadales bacterium]